MARGLSAFDIVVILAYLAGTTLLGIGFGRGEGAGTGAASKGIGSVENVNVLAIGPGPSGVDLLGCSAVFARIPLLGIWVGRRQRDAKDYFIAGRSIPWWAVMFSVVASETSALTF